MTASAGVPCANLKRKLNAVVLPAVTREHL